MILEQNLQKLGLTEKQAQVYVAALELGTDSVLNIAKKAGIKRPTAYVILDELMAKGMVSEKPTSKGNMYIAEDPDTFGARLQEQETVFANTLPLLKALHNIEKGKPQVRVYEGIEGMRTVYFETVWKSKTEILFFSSIKKIIEHIPDLLELWLKDMNTKYPHTKTKEFINPDPVDIDYALKAVKNNTGQEARVLPDNLKYHFVSTDNAIFEDKFMIVSFGEKLFTTIIQSQAIADTMRALFYLGWNQAVAVEEYVKQHPEVRNKK